MPATVGEERFVGGRFSWEAWSTRTFALPSIAWAPDSRRLVYSDGERVSVVERDRTPVDEIGRGWQATNPVGDPKLQATDPQWAFDGSPDRLSFRQRRT
jgi:hypothetical protein